MSEATIKRRKTPLQPVDITPEMCSPAMRLQILGGVPFFSGLGAPDLEEINRLFREQGFQPREIIYFEEDSAEQFYVLAAGKAKLMRHTRTGKDVLLDLLRVGDYFGSLSSSPDETYTETAQAHTAVCTLTIGKDIFRSILSNRPEVALRVLEITTGRLAASQEMVRQLSAHPVKQRIAYILLKLADKFGQPRGKGVLIQTPLSRDELADMVGTTTESASRAISQLQKAGLIKTGRQWVSITNRQGLQAILAEY